MKKILFSVLAAGLSLSSCNMDLDEPGSITDTEAIQTVQDVEKFRNDLYSNFRAINAGEYVTSTEMQSDFFVGLRGNGGRGSTWTQSNLTAATSEIAGPYAACYGVIANINFMLPYAEALEGQVEGNDAVQLNRYIGETYFMRAFLYYWLLDHYCGRYEPSALGLQITTNYDPSIPNSEYPGRSSMEASVNFIKEDLAKAYNRLKAFEQVDATYLAACSPYLSSYVVEALQARLALITRDYDTAITKANSVIGSGIYALASVADYPNMWINDESTELLMVPFGDVQEAGSFGSYFNQYNYIDEYPTRVNCVPTMNVLALYDDNDVRFDAFYLPLQMTIEAQSTFAFIFNKFPGNPALNGASNAYKNKPKPFRLSEMYLILAEATYEKGTGDALAPLNELRKQRIANYQEETGLGGLALRDAIRNERAKELIGEGFRMSDLRRWQMEMRRDATYGVYVPGTVDVAELFNNADIATVLVPGVSPYYTWPIPRNEFEVCPAMAGQQNPGY